MLGYALPICLIYNRVQWWILAQHSQSKLPALYVLIILTIHNTIKIKSLRMLQEDKRARMEEMH